MNKPVYDNSGILFPNDKKLQANHADYKGNATINGEAYFMDAWKKRGEKGVFLSFLFKKKTGKYNKEPAGAPKFEDDDFPF